MDGITLGRVRLNGNVTLAPMAGYGDVAFRRLCRDYGAALTTTEMISVKGLLYQNEKTETLLRLAPNETPSCVQLFGGEPDCFTAALGLPLLHKFDIIDINMGCPVPKVTKNGEGSALMRDVPRAAKIVEACVKAAGGRPVTVKFRLGWDDGSRNAVAFARAMESSGAAAATVHGRTAAQLYRGKADWDGIAAVAAAVKIPVLGNGDVSGATECGARLKGSGCAGIALGRGALGHPELFREIAGGSADLLIQVILQHIDYVSEYFPEGVGVRELRKHLAYYLKGVPDCKQLRGELNGIDTFARLRQRLSETLGGRIIC